VDMNKRIIENHLGSLEALVMRILWDRGEMSVRDVLAAMPSRTPRAYTTIMTVMNRLWEKDLLDRRPVGRAHVYKPRVGEDEFVEQLARQTVRSLIAEFGGAAVAHFVGELQDSDPEEFAKLRELLSKEET
jgi:predicted transcriptional regulator